VQVQEAGCRRERQTVRMQRMDMYQAQAAPGLLKV